MTLSLTIGSRPIIAGTFGGAGQVTNGITGTTGSTVGSFLVAVLGNAVDTGATTTAADAGWTQLAAISQGTASRLEIWVYPNNPGGIRLFHWTSTATNWHATIGEFIGVASASYLDSSGTATATSGNTLNPATGAGISVEGDAALSAWIQKIAAPATVTFTAAPNWIAWSDTGAATDVQHLHGDYLVSPPVGPPVLSTLTSDHTTTSAAGAIIALKRGAPAVDVTAYLGY